MLTSNVAEQATALLKGEVPPRWDAIWEGPEEPLAFIRAAMTRLGECEKLYQVPCLNNNNKQ
eukprot:1085050-Prorocentrum_minimum.AAC.1